MSGYLTRLAERALNQAPIVHANASLPFFTAPEPLPAGAQPATGNANAGVRATRDVPAVPVLHPSVPAEPPALPQAPARDAAAPALAAPARVNASRAADTVVHEPPLNAPTPHAPAPQRLSTPTPVAAPVPRLPPLERISAAGVVRARPPLAVSARRPLPAAVLAGVQSDLAHSSAAAIGPDVHIHIGRIELTALPEAGPPRKKAATGKKPMSLDEYLHGRAGQTR